MKTDIRHQDGSHDSPGFLPWFVIALGVLVLKAPDALSNPQFWAEDGIIFFLQQRTMGLGSLFEQMVAYLHLAPRLVAQLAAPLPAWLVPLAYNAAAIAGGAASLAFLCTRLHDRVLGIVFLLAVLLSLTNGEIFGTLTNLQWFLQLFLLGACFAPAGPRGPLRTPAMLALVLVASLTGPFSVLLLLVLAAAVGLSLLPGSWLPTARLRAWLRGLDRWRLLMLAIGACAQVRVYLVHRIPGSTAMGVRDVAKGIGDVLQAHTFGSVVLPTLMFLLLLAAMLVALLRQARHDSLADDRFLLLAMAGLGVLQVAAGMAKMGIPLEVAVSDRYVFVFKLFFWTAVAMLLQGLFRSRSQVLAISLAAIGFVALNHPGYLRRAPLEDKQWRTYAPALDRGEKVDIPTHPTPWVIPIPARQDTR